MKGEPAKKTIALVAETMSKEGMTRIKASEKLKISMSTIKKCLHIFNKKPTHPMSLKSKIL